MIIYHDYHDYHDRQCHCYYYHHNYIITVIIVSFIFVITPFEIMTTIGRCWYFHYHLAFSASTVLFSPGGIVAPVIQHFPLVGGKEHVFTFPIQL